MGPLLRSEGTGRGIAERMKGVACRPWPGPKRLRCGEIDRAPGGYRWCRYPRALPPRPRSIIATWDRDGRFRGHPPGKRVVERAIRSWPGSPRMLVGDRDALDGALHPRSGDRTVRERSQAVLVGRT